jgi:hypothetical protein
VTRADRKKLAKYFTGTAFMVGAASSKKKAPAGEPGPGVLERQ